MGEGAGGLGQARSAVARGAWDEAFDLLAAADAAGDLSPADLPELAGVAYAAGRLDVTVGTWERVWAAAAAAGDDVAAAGAAVRVAMHLLFDTALMAPVRGWLARAERLLDGRAPTPAHAWLAAVRSYERMLSGDLAGARRWAATALDGDPALDPAATAVARVAAARLLILDGRVPEGLALLDEAGTATVSGELDPLSVGVVYCELVCALQGLARYDLAEQWTEAMERWSRAGGIGSLPGRCRVHRAEILRLRGACAEAEREALLACAELRPWLRRELGWPLAELGRIRLHTGDLAGAEEALLAAERAGWDPEPALALVRLARGDGAGAVRGVRDALERPAGVPSKERPPDTDLQRAPLLAAQVEIELAAGEPARARAAAAELAGVAGRFDTEALSALAAHARGRVQVADGDPEGAGASLAEAVRRWTAIGAPYEAARARLDLADALAVAGDARRADRERDAARAALAALASPAEPTAGPDAEPGPGPAAAEFRREGDYWSVVFDGRTVRVRDLRGMRHLARLLAEPGRELHVLDLAAGTGDPAASRVSLGDAGPLLDERAREAYRRRLAEIDADLDEARALGAAQRLAQAETERDLLVGELARAFGLGGRQRRAGAASERARVGVTRAVRQAITRIGAHHPALGEHLDRTIRTGTYCVYLPDPRAPVAWRL